MWSTENSDVEAILAFYNLKKTRKRSFSFPFLDLCLFGCLEREEKHGKSNETERRPVLSPPLLRAQRRVWGGGPLGAGRPVPRRCSEQSLGPRWGWLRLGASERDLGARARTPARRPAPGSWPDAAPRTLGAGQAGARGATARSEASLSRRQARARPALLDPRALPDPVPLPAAAPLPPSTWGAAPRGQPGPLESPQGHLGGGYGGGGDPSPAEAEQGVACGPRTRSAGAG